MMLLANWHHPLIESTISNYSIVRILSIYMHIYAAWVDVVIKKMAAYLNDAVLLFRPNNDWAWYWYTIHEDLRSER